MAKGDHLGEFEQIVLLALVRLRDDAYGVTIRQELEKRADRDVSIGAVYATLDRLEAKRLVTSQTGDPTPERGGRAKRHFTITAAGAKALDQARQVHNRLWEGVRLRGVTA